VLKANVYDYDEARRGGLKPWARAATFSLAEGSPATNQL